jgi:hypothetical protein
MDWFVAANEVNKSIAFFGIASHLGAPIPGHVVFLDQLPPTQRTPVRIEGLNKMRIGEAEMVRGELEWIATGMKPANARLVSAALRDTGAVVSPAILPADRPALLAMLDKARAATKDEVSRSNLSAFGSLMVKAK